VAKLLARQFPTMDQLPKPAKRRSARCVCGRVDRAIGPAVLYQARGRGLIKRLASAGLNVTEPVVARSGSGKLADQTYVITGTLPNLSRQQAKALLEDAGAHVADSVSKKTTAVVVGADPGARRSAPSSSACLSLMKRNSLAAVSANPP